MLRFVFLICAFLITGCSSWRQNYNGLLLPAPTSPSPATDTVSVTWLGTAGFLVSDGETSLLVDPFVSRYGLLKVGLGKVAPDEALIDAWLAKLRVTNTTYVLVSHSHYDHSMDAPHFARQTGAKLVGSESTLHIGRGAGLAEEQMVRIENNHVLEAGAFRIRFLESVHGKALFGRIPYPGEINEPLTPPAPANAYKLGAAYSIVIEHPRGTMVHHASAGIIPGMYESVKADVVMLGIAGRQNTAGYVNEVVNAVGAKRLILTHFDDFFVPLAEEMEELWFVDFDEFVDSSRKTYPDVRLETVPLGEARPIF
jgi:L-ascorbate metabolism protein UlaG (beta-lactamase superfamily)